MKQYFTFNNLQDALNYRHDNGLGGWIFAPENDKPKGFANFADYYSIRVGESSCPLLRQHLRLQPRPAGLEALHRQPA
jgi:hypothetical protein